MIFGQLIVGMQQNALATQRIVFQSKDWGRPHVETLHARLRRRMRHSMHLIMQDANPDSYYQHVQHPESVN